VAIIGRLNPTVQGTYNKTTNTPVGASTKALALVNGVTSFINPPVVVSTVYVATTLSSLTTFDTYKFQDIAAPTGSTVSKVELIFAAVKGSGNTNIKPRMRLAGVDVDLTHQTIITSGPKYLTFDFTASRPTGGSWAPTDFVGAGVEAGWATSYSGAPKVHGMALLVSLATLPTPVVTTTAASDISSTLARLNATVDSGGMTSQYPFVWHFEYGLNITGDLLTTPNVQYFGGPQNIGVQVTGLSRSNEYFFRIVSTGESGVVMGEFLSFTTLANDAAMLVL